MKIALVSDTHGICREELLEQIKKCDYLIHVGDFERESCYQKLQETGIPMYAVRGNSDRGEWVAYLHAFLAVPIGGKMFYLVHNQMDLPLDLSDADFVIYGHTHVFAHYERHGKVYINPGTAGQDRGDGKSMAVLTLKEDGYKLERIYL